MDATKALTPHAHPGASVSLDFTTLQPAVDDPRTILHVDLDCFFVSVERVLDPSLAGRPVIVGGAADQRGVVCSASREARDLGVHSAMPTAVAERLCPEAVFLPGRGRLYARASAAAFKVLREFAPVVERASIDEAYLDASETLERWSSAFDLAAAIQCALEDRLGLPSSVGIASNKLVAKVACARAKPAGILEVWPGYERAFLAPLPAGALPGVGPVLARKLQLFGLQTVEQVARVNPALLEATFGALGRDLARKSRGIGTGDLTADEEPKSIGRERTLARDVGSTATLLEEVHALSKEVAHRLRRRGLKGRAITLKLRTSDFRTPCRTQTLRSPTDLESEIAGVACFLLREIHERGLRVRLVGVSVGRLGEEPRQALLFPEPIPRVEPSSPERGAGLAWLKGLLPVGRRGQM